MRTQDVHQKDLAELFAIYLNRGDRVRLVEYLVTHSNLPGPRGNLELAQAFAEEAAVRTGPDQDKVWTFCLNLAGISPAHAPTNSPMEFLPFCGAVGLGAVAAASPQRVDRALTELRRLADDSRWRMREAVAMALQELLRHHPQKTLARLKTWIADEHWLAMAAVAGGGAEPDREERRGRGGGGAARPRPGPPPRPVGLRLPRLQQGGTHPLAEVAHRVKGDRRDVARKNKIPQPLDGFPQDRLRHRRAGPEGQGRDIRAAGHPRGPAARLSSGRLAGPWRPLRPPLAARGQSVRRTGPRLHGWPIRAAH